jgi:hypothetical protein
MFPVDAFRATLEKILEILSVHHIKFHLTGGVTNIAYSEPRFTQDIDIVVDNVAIAKHLDSFIASLRSSDFLFDEVLVRTAVESRRLFQLIDSVEALKLDIYPRELIPGELDRSNSIELFSGKIIPIASLPDTAIAKLIWIDKGSHKSRRDLRQLMRIASEPQRQGIERLADEIGLRQLLSDVMRESDEIEA